MDQTNKHSTAPPGIDPAVSSSIFVGEKGENSIRNNLNKSELSIVILDPDLECHLLTFNRLLVVFCHILSTTGE